MYQLLQWNLDIRNGHWNGKICSLYRGRDFAAVFPTRLTALGSPRMLTKLERFSYDLEMKTREQNRNNKRTEIERFDWCIERIQTHLAFGWLGERSGKQTSCPKNFLEIALTSYCNTIGQSNNAFSILGFSLAGKRRVHVLFFPSIG